MRPHLSTAIPIAIPQVSAEARCQYPDAMARLHKFMLSDIPNRASRLRDLQIVVQRRKNLHEDKDSAALLVDLLENTTNLRRLSIGHFFHLPFDVSRVENAIAALSHLADIHLHGNSLKTLKAIVKPARNLRVLRLRGFGACRSDPFLTLLSVLPGHHQLRELHLNDLGDRIPSSGSLPWEQYPSVVTLTVTGRTPPIYALANAFPNVRSLSLSDVDINFASANGQCWQALRHFKASDVHDAAMWGIVCPVHHLELKEELDFYGDNLLKLISNVSPVMASLWCWDDMTMELWETIVKAAPRLRCLRLDITTSTTCLGDSLEKLMDRILGPFHIVPLDIQIFLTDELRGNLSLGHVRIRLSMGGVIRPRTSAFLRSSL
ncbi:hypothetical protein A0H81_04743 [Grifola frondosa]|uniref:Uncharacterized protein n=1 Tax=Grifola frondosa TaxID=5627 RepID=A0A1C7MKF2_GRIFR|nr:hypothetical protein A0H81_04743 [Grifola frondosa]